tara:strand:- start:3184 stop:3651 length:468 start_codon:yes stop_codon:yes gene_type:complete
MPNYKSRDEEVDYQDGYANAMDLLNAYGADKVIQPKEDKPEEKSELLGGFLSEIMDSDKPHKQMVRSVLAMKPKDIHILKKSVKYFLDNPEELKRPVNPEILEDLRKVKSNNDLADMLEEDYEETDGGAIGEGDSLIEGLADVIHSIPNIQKTLR